MKKFMLLILFVMMISLVSAIDAPAIDISLLNQDPDPVGPGEYVELRFKIFNSRAQTVANDFEVKLETDYPFFLDNAEDSLKSFGDLPSLGSGENVVVARYRVRVDDNAVEGSNPIRISYRHDGTDWITRKFDVNVQTLDANLAIISVKTEPEKIKPGEEATVRVKVKNMADSTMRDVTMKLDLTFENYLSLASTVSATDRLAAFNALPFAPLDSATEQKIFSLAPGEEKEFVYHLIAYSDAESKVYKVPVEITYYDEVQTEYQKNDIIGLIVGTKPDLTVVIDETDLYVGKKTGEVIVRFINKGFSDVKFLDVHVEDNEEIQIISSNEVYIGNVDSDDYETADFQVYLKNGASKQESDVKFPILIEYRDANNNVYTETYDLDLHILPQNKIEGASSNGVGFFTVVLLMAVSGVIFFFMGKRSARKKK